MKVLMDPSLQGLSGRWGNLVFGTRLTAMRPETWGTTKCNAREYVERIAPIPLLQENINNAWKFILIAWASLKLNTTAKQTWITEAIAESITLGYNVNAYNLFTGYFLLVYTAMVGSHVPISGLSDGAGMNWVQRTSRYWFQGVDMGYIIQVQSTQTGAVATGTTITPNDDTIPQNTEGTQFMTLAITPNSVSNRLQIEVDVFCTVSVAAWLTVAIFQDSVVNALATTAHYELQSTAGSQIHLSHIIAAGTISATTFKVRVGAHLASTVTFNGQSSARSYGNSLASQITITEMAP